MRTVNWYTMEYILLKYSLWALFFLQESNEQKKSDLYEHVKDSRSHHDAQTLDVATAEQLEEQGQITEDKEGDNSDVDDAEMANDEKDIEVCSWKMKNNNINSMHNLFLFSPYMLCTVLHKS